MKFLLFAVFTCFCTTGVHAQLVITEVNSNGTPADFWELTNFGGTAVDLSGFRWDDDSANPADPAARIVPAGTSIAPSESIVFATGAVTVASFRSAWNLPGTVQVIIGGPGLGQNDAVFFYNAASQLTASLPYALNGFTRSNGLGALGGHAGASAGGTPNVSLILDPNFGTANRRYTFATGGNFATYAANAPNDAVGSPGLVGVAGTNSLPVFTSATQTYWKTGMVLTNSPYRVTAVDTDPGQSVTLSVVSKPAWLTLTVSAPGAYRLGGTPPAAGDYEFTVRATDNAVPAGVTEQTFILTAFPTTSPIILNEYNAVGANDFLRGGTATQDGVGVSPGPTDSFFGRVAGNGGQWVEFVVVGGGSAASPVVDMRGWTIEVLDATGTRSIVLSQDPYWQSVVPGTILTFTASNAASGGLDTELHRTGARHNLGYLWSNVWVFDPNLIDQSASTITADLGIGSDDTRFVVKNPLGNVIYGPSGEGVASAEGTPGVLLGVNSTETLRLQANPAPTVDPLFGVYNDADSGSSFGARNVWGSGPTVQSFAAFVFGNSPPAITSTPVTRAYGSYSYQVSTSDPNGQSVTLTAPVLPEFLTLSGSTLSTNRPLTLADAGEHVVRLVASDGGNVVTPQVFTLTVFHDQPTVILNEYNAVADTNFLNGGDASTDSDGAPPAADSHFGRVLGNGGRWFELVVIGNGGPSTVDMRGWEIVIGSSVGGSFTPSNRLELSQDAYWSAIPAGTILTFIDRTTANGGLNTEINRRNRLDSLGDAWTNVWIGDPTLLEFTSIAENGYTIGDGSVEGIRIDQNDTQFILLNALDQPVFGPVGEGIAPGSGISSTEVFKLGGHPSPAVSPLDELSDTESGYDDGASGSTFGHPNGWEDGIVLRLQDFTPFIVTGTPFELWVGSFDLEGEDAESGADSDQDGRSNFEEYVFGGNPTQADGPPVSQQIVQGETSITWSYLRRSDDPTLDYIHQQSPDLEGWAPIPTEALEVTAVPHPTLAGYEIVTVVASPVAEAPWFFRATVFP